MKKLISITACTLIFGFVGCSDDETGSGQNGTTNSGSGDMTASLDMSGTASDQGSTTSDQGGTQGDDGTGGGGGDAGSDVTDMGGGSNLDSGMLPDVPFDINDMGQIICKHGEPCACSDGIDNDGDGVVDGFDSECTGPFDDDEGSFATGISGDNMDPKWQDCFFDGDSGAGNDGCRYSTECLTGELPPTDPDCIVSDECINFCQKFTPSGCDCFGCCEVYDSQGQVHNVVIGSECSDENLDDPTKCMTCTPTDQCGNTCGECELCLGKTIDDLPDTCFMTSPDPDMGSGTPGSDMGGGTPGSDMGGTTGSDMGGSNPGNPGYTCDDGQAYCSESYECDDGSGVSWYCLQGCCYEIPG